ncbi:MAG: hypothetical protein EBU08_23450 [Micrococcales bacterium]|nr:hypothetical protein [Micrococcales bacterium]
MELFGFKLERSQKQQTDFKALKSFVVPTTDDGAIPVEAGGFYGQYVDLDGSVRNDFELVAKYREMSMDPICEIAVDDIVNEAIITEPGKMPVKMSFTNDNTLSPKIKNKIEEEFKNVLRLLSFDTRGYEVFRRWYVDGKVYFHIIVDEEKPEKQTQFAALSESLSHALVLEVQRPPVDQRAPPRQHLNLMKTLTTLFVMQKETQFGKMFSIPKLVNQ